MNQKLFFPLVDETVEEDAPTSSSNSKRVVRHGVATNDLVLSAYLEGNDAVFPKILDVYVKPGSVVADVTCGEGVFWRDVDSGSYDLRSTDIKTGVDCRNLPYRDREIDCVVLDPPYMHSPGGSAPQISRCVREVLCQQRSWRTNEPQVPRCSPRSLHRSWCRSTPRLTRARRLHREMPRRSLRQPPTLHTRRDHEPPTRKLGFVAEDLFVVVRKNRPGRQPHDQTGSRPQEPLLLPRLLETRSRPRKMGTSAINPIDLMVQVIEEHSPESIWQNSPLSGYRQLGNTNRGQIGEDFIRRYLTAANIPVSNSGLAQLPPTSSSRANASKSKPPH